MMLSLLLLIPGTLAQYQVEGPAYTSQSAEDKQFMIWENVISDTSSNDWPGLSLGEIFFESMCPTMLVEEDQLPIAWTGNSRKKYIHSVGNVAKVEFVSSGDHPYTGVFSGATNGIIRASFAAEPSADILNTTPGIGLKFLRDGVASANLVAMFSVDGQDTWNFFANDFSNHIPATTSGPLVLLADKFATATPYVQYVGLSDWAEIGENGEAVANARFPFSLRFQPTGEIMFEESYHGLFTDDLASIPEGSVLWRVYALDQPIELGGTEQLIGELVSTSPLVTSLWGDSHLFFHHQDMREDIAKFPQWADYLETVYVPGGQSCTYHKNN